MLDCGTHWMHDLLEIVLVYVPMYWPWWCYHLYLISYSFVFARRSCRGGILDNRMRWWECTLAKAGTRSLRERGLLCSSPFYISASMFSSGTSWNATSYRRYIINAKRNDLIDSCAVFSFPSSHCRPPFPFILFNVSSLSTFLFPTMNVL